MWITAGLLLLLTNIPSVAGELKHGAFWQLTDIHFDPWYLSDQESCRKTLSKLGKFGDFECDVPWDLVLSSIQAMKDLQGDSDVDFILWSGDNLPHIKRYFELLSKEGVIEILRNLTNVITSVYPDKLVIPVLGNHDYFPRNQLPGNSNDLYDAFADMWSMWLTTRDMKKTFRKGGYYTLMLDTVKKIRGIVMNNNLYLTSNMETEGQRDPGGQLRWMERTLKKARKRGERVHIFTHVPPGKVPKVLEGTSFFRDEQNSRQVDIFIKYSDIILGMYSAHSHHDIFKLFYKNENAVAAMLVAPAVTPRRSLINKDTGEEGPARNPALRLITFDVGSGKLFDVKQYSMDLEKSNRKEKPLWKFLYSFKEKYGLDDVSPEQLNSLLQRMKKDENKDTFKMFHKLYSVDTKHPANVPCNCTCKSTFLCAVEFQIYSQFDECFENDEYCDKSANQGTVISGGEQQSTGGNNRDESSQVVGGAIKSCSPKGENLGCECKAKEQCALDFQECKRAKGKCKSTGKICCCPPDKWEDSCDRKP